MKPQILSAILTVALCMPAAATPPPSLNNLVLNMNITSGSGIFADAGESMFIPEKSGNRYWIVAMDEGIENSAGTFTYDVDGETASVQISDSELGMVAITDLTFHDDLSGTFSIANDLGTQAGTFTIDYRLASTNVEYVDLGGLLLKADADGKLNLELNVRTSGDLAHWTEAEGDFQVLTKSKVSWSFLPSETREFFRIIAE